MNDVSSLFLVAFSSAPAANPLGGAASAHLRNDLDKSRNQDVKDLCVYALGTCTHSVNGNVGCTLNSNIDVGVCAALAGIHNAGMLRHDRNLTERLFSAGVVKVCAVSRAGVLLVALSAFESCATDLHRTVR